MNNLHNIILFFFMSCSICATLFKDNIINYRTEKHKRFNKCKQKKSKCDKNESEVTLMVTHLFIILLIFTNKQIKNR